MIARKDYMSGKVSHSDYYSQFVTTGIRHLVVMHFGIDELIVAYAKDENFNTLPLDEWDSMAYSLHTVELRKAFKDAGDFWTLSSGVCTLKQAAREVVEGKDWQGGEQWKSS